jgi:hypothetical protein
MIELSHNPNEPLTDGQVCQYTFGSLYACKDLAVEVVTFGQFGAWTYAYCAKHADRFREDTDDDQF